MKHIKYLLVGILFGIIMTKSEAISWFRIQEMFRFESFHMYGIIGTAVIGGALLVFVLKKINTRTIEGEDLALKATLLGHGIWSILLVILSAAFGTFVYGLLRSKLPH